MQESNDPCTAVYLSGPMTNMPGLNYQAFMNEAALLRRLGMYGDTGHVTSNEQQRKNCSDAQRAKAVAQPHVYRKLTGRHEHRVVAEQMLGRPLKRGEIVHHIDGDRHNNAPTNLQVMTQADHLRLHHAEMWVARKAKKCQSS